MNNKIQPSIFIKKVLPLLGCFPLLLVNCGAFTPGVATTATSTATSLPPAVTQEPTSTSTPKPVPVSFKLQFDSVSDLDWLYLRPFRFSFRNLIPDEVYLVDGSLRIGGATKLRGIHMATPIIPNTLFHTRTRVSEDGFCYSISLSPLYVPKSICISGCPNGLYQPVVVYNLTRTEQKGVLPSTGEVPVLPDEWLDTIFWFTPDKARMFYFIGNTSDRDSLLYGAVGLPPDWVSEQWELFLQGDFESDYRTDYPVMQYLDIDFIHMTQGSIKNYLYHNLAAYAFHEPEIDQYLAAEPSSLTDVEITP